MAKNPFKKNRTGKTPEQISAEVEAMHRDGAVSAPTAKARAEHAESLRLTLLGRR